MEQVNRIIVDQGMKMKLHKQGYGSRITITKALKGYAETPQAIRIREAALANGGIEVKSHNNGTITTTGI